MSVLTYVNLYHVFRDKRRDKYSKYSIKISNDMSVDREKNPQEGTGRENGFRVTAAHLRIQGRNLKKSHPGAIRPHDKPRDRKRVPFALPTACATSCFASLVKKEAG